MSKVIDQIVAQYNRLPVNCPERKRAFGVIYNNTQVGGVLLCQHEAGKRVTNQVLARLGYTDKASVTGDLDDL